MKVLHEFETQQGDPVTIDMATVQAIRKDNEYTAVFLSGGSLHKLRQSYETVRSCWRLPKAQPDGDQSQPEQSPTPVQSGS